MALPLEGILAVPWLLLGCDLPGAGAGPTDALIVREGVLLGSEVGRMTAILVVNLEKLSAFEAFSPNDRRRPSADLPGGWEAG